MPIEEGRLGSRVLVDIWPPPQDGRFLWHEEGNQSVVLTSHVDGRFGVWRIEGSTPPILLFESARVRPTGPGEIELAYWWSGSRAGVTINGVEVPSFDPEGPTVDVNVRPSGVPDILATSHPDAVANCQIWIDRRRSKFATNRVRTNRRPKTDQEQADELWAALQDLVLFHRAVVAGRDSHLGIIASLLRSLLYWANDDRPDAQYSPLLLRMASKADIPLPVYNSGPPALPQSLPASGQLPSIAHPAFVSTPQAYSVVDLQEVLAQDSLYYSVQLPNGSREGRRLSPKGVIAEYANALGISHFDEDAPIFADALASIGQADQDALSIFICELAATVVPLGIWVLCQLGERGVIDPPPSSPPQPNISPQSPPPRTE